MENNQLEDKEYSLMIKFRPVKDENGNIPKNATMQYSIDLGQAIGIDCNAVISAGMFLVETIIKHIEKVKNEKDSLQLDTLSRPRTNPPESGASKTRPDQAMSMRELMDRYRRGMPLDTVNRTPQYHNGEFPDLTRMDLSEIESLKRATYQEVERLQTELKKQQEDKQRAAWEAKDKEIQELKRQLEAKQRPEAV